jgi:hypothetical protein
MLVKPWLPTNYSVSVPYYRIFLEELKFTRPVKRLPDFMDRICIQYADYITPTDMMTGLIEALS